MNPPGEGKGNERRRICRMLALLWIFPSLGALLLLARGDGWTVPMEGAAWWTGITLEGWIAGTLLGAHLALLWQGWKRNAPAP